MIRRMVDSVPVGYGVLMSYGRDAPADLEKVVLVLGGPEPFNQETMPTRMVLVEIGLKLSEDELSVVRKIWI